MFFCIDIPSSPLHFFKTGEEGQGDEGIQLDETER